MCTAICYRADSLFFGRTLDYHRSFGEEIVITPRNFKFSDIDISLPHFALIGTAHKEDNYPLYYECANEKGLCMAGLNFLFDTVYQNPEKGAENLAPHQLVPKILATCATVGEAVTLLQGIRITDTGFSPELPAARLHWIIADNNSAVTVESVAEGLKIYENTIGVLTNDPPFDKQLENLQKYGDLKPYKKGEKAEVIPGDPSSTSRFVRAAYYLKNSPRISDNRMAAEHFFHIADTVSVPLGSVFSEDGEYKTIYTSCINTQTGEHFYTTNQNRQISTVSLKNTELNGDRLTSFKM